MNQRMLIRLLEEKEIVKNVEITCPLAVKDYNQNMNFVDKFDQLKGSYAIDRKSKKWWHRLFFHFLDCTVVNAFILYKDLQENPDSSLEKLCLKDFRRQLYQNMLVPAYINRKRMLQKNPQSSPSPSLAFIKNHKPEVQLEEPPSAAADAVLKRNL